MGGGREHVNEGTGKKREVQLTRQIPHSNHQSRGHAFAISKDDAPARVSGSSMQKTMNTTEMVTVCHCEGMRGTCKRDNIFRMCAHWCTPNSKFNKCEVTLSTQNHVHSSTPALPSPSSSLSLSRLLSVPSSLPQSSISSSVTLPLPLPLAALRRL